MTISTSDIVGLVIVEAMSLVLLAGLWRRKRVPLVRRLGWSVVLLLPVLGPVVYLMLKPFPASGSVEAPEVDEFDMHNQDPSA